MRTLVIAEHSAGQLTAGTWSAVTAATALGAKMDLLVMGGADASAVAQQAALIQGLDRVLLAQGGMFENALAENIQPLITSLVAGGYTHVVADASSMGRNVLPRVAASLDVGMLSDVTHIVSTDTFQRPIYAGNAIATVQSLDPIKLLTVRASAFAQASSQQHRCEVVAVEGGQNASNVRFVSEQLTASERPDLSSARVVVSGGRGMQSKENFALIERVADKLGGAVGASRAAVDSGFAPNDLQVGQTGKIVAPELYIAAGISGAIQHLAGMSGSKVIVAINQDPEAPIAQVADYMLVADVFEALPALEKAL
ncbi:electron transfer flavoprotein subunit alpha/FixB family protein [Pseudomonas corrugata]|uniref:electron transfer flavoprotein subunit alpha/FixB family protein n=1 Tax=Pseudomonas corrugata TaxID=47879 RepID=UPI00158623CA|nr:FAD-binding protein [Pseudomonas corrugata]MCI0996833.1 electron transfer flavoprotein subunit alpha/FixB family protein [Pseudomonas corrugata]NUT66109.1 electron transfer flavoprotein subunit alpha/FixB family protein [Pseudomonas corrugata]